MDPARQRNCFRILACLLLTTGVSSLMPLRAVTRTVPHLHGPQDQAERRAEGMIRWLDPAHGRKFTLPAVRKRTQMAAQSASIFDPVLSSLQKGTRVPLRLPAYLANEEEASPLYANVEKAEPSEYSVSIDFTEDCGGATACHWGSASGQAAKPGAKHARGKAVKLAHGITGYFEDAKCGASCGDSELSWDENGYRYTVTLKAGKEESLVKVANSAIESGGGAAR